MMMREGADRRSCNAPLHYSVGKRRLSDVRGTYQLRPLVPVHFGHPEDVHMGPNMDVVFMGRPGDVHMGPNMNVVFMGCPGDV